jgi:D-alanyl-D-alanine carboxypeptidase
MEWFSRGIAVRLAAALTLVVAVGCTAGHKMVAPTPDVPDPSASSTTAPRFPDPGKDPLPAEKVAALQAVLDGLVAEDAQLKRGGFPDPPDVVSGVTAAVLSDRGSWSGAAGRSDDGSPLTPSTMMAIGSISKTFTAAEVLHLAGEGKLDLEAPLSKYLHHRLAGNGATVRQALNMTSGVSGEAELDAALSQVSADPERHWTPQQTVSVLKGRPARPGGRPVYSSANYLLLGMLVEQVSRQPLAAALRADLIKPAGLVRVAVQDGERPTPPLAAPPRRLELGSADGYLPSRAVASAGFSAAGMAADAPSLARWGYQLYGARVLSADLSHAMVVQQSADDIEFGTGYGLGTMLFHHLQFGIADSVGHSGATPGYLALLTVVPERHLSVAVLVPDEDKDIGSIMRKLFAVLR